MDPESLHYKAKDACTALVTVCKALSEGVEAKCSEDELVDHLRHVASAAVNMTKTVSAHLEAREPEKREKAELQENFLMDYVKSLREATYQLIMHTQNYYANPMDYMTQQNRNNSVKEVIQLVKSLVEASKGMFLIWHRGPITVRFIELWCLVPDVLLPIMRC